MKFLKIATVWLSLLGIIDAAALPPKDVKLEEIMSKLREVIMFCDRNQTVCEDILVPEVIPSREKNPPREETFCKTEASLNQVKAPQGDLNSTLTNLISTLQINGLKKKQRETSLCTLKEDVKIDLISFLKDLLKYSQMLYQNVSRKQGITDTLLASATI